MKQSCQSFERQQDQSNPGLGWEPNGLTPLPHPTCSPPYYILPHTRTHEVEWCVSHGNIKVVCPVSAACSHRTIFDQNEKVNLPRLIMNQLRWLNHVVNSQVILYALSKFSIDCHLNVIYYYVFTGKIPTN